MIDGEHFSHPAPMRLSQEAGDRGVDEQGFKLIEQLLIKAEVQQLLMDVGASAAAGRRNMLDVHAVATWARSARIIDLVRLHAGGEPRPVRAIWFNKSAEANWLVAWHQDLAIAVRERVDVPGFGAWSVKEGVPHVQPPTI